MKNLAFAVIAFASCQLAAGSLFAQVSAPESRENVLAKAERFEVIPVGSSTARFKAAVDPFYNLEIKDEVRAATLAATATPSAPAQGAAPTVSDRVVLRQLAERINPTGVMQFGENSLLLFGERRVRVGDFLSIAHNGAQYQVEVVKVDARTFTIRLNNELISKRIQ